jgi:polyhydroxyalkanoate synthesis regulator phasin
LSGVPENQAEAISNAFKEAQGEAELATKRDITDLRHEIHDLKRDMHDLEQRLIIRLGGLIAVAIGIVAALVKLL